VQPSGRIIHTAFSPFRAFVRRRSPLARSVCTYPCRPSSYSIVRDSSEVSDSVAPGLTYPDRAISPIFFSYTFACFRDFEKSSVFLLLEVVVAAACSLLCSSCCLRCKRSTCYPSFFCFCVCSFFFNSSFAYTKDRPDLITNICREGVGEHPFHLEKLFPVRTVFQKKKKKKLSYN